MDIIEKARELGRLIQEEDSYKKLQDKKMWFRSGNTRMIYIDFQLNNYTQ